MAKKKKDPTASDDNGKKELTSAQKRTLFEKASKAADALEAAREEVELAKDALSATVEAIFNNCGSGPFSFGGQKLIAAKKGDRFFFKSPPSRPIEKID